LTITPGFAAGRYPDRMSLQWDPDGPARGRVVLLHGMASLSATWWRTGPGLAARGWQVVAPDLPGHGTAARLSGPLDLDTLVEGVAGRLPTTIDLLVGHSLGAIVALALAGRRPATAGALVLEDPPGPSGADQASLADTVAADAELVRLDRERFIRNQRDANPRWAPEDIQHALDGVAAADTAAIVAGLHGPLLWDPATLLPLVRVPMLVLAAPDAPPGTFDQDGGTALRGHDRRAVQALVPPDRFVVLDGSHCLHRDQPDRWLESVSAFADATLGS
jgi:pimeloyl-ACP methyl ester carboxylesterase